MAVVVYTANPSLLLGKIKTAIDTETVETWIVDADGDFTHEPNQWRNKAWFRPYVASGVLQFGLVGPEGVQVSTVVYAVYHGRFIEMLLTHFDGDFSNATATAQADSKVDSFK